MASEIPETLTILYYSNNENRPSNKVLQSIHEITGSTVLALPNDWNLLLDVSEDHLIRLKEMINQVIITKHSKNVTPNFMSGQIH